MSALWVALAAGMVVVALGWRAARRRTRAAGAATDAKPERKFLDLPAAEALQWMQAHPGQGRVLDVRTRREYEGGHVPGSQHIPVNQLEKRYQEVSNGAERLFVVCLGGVRSAAACEILADKGYSNLVNIEDGMNGWRGPLEQGPAGRVSA